MRRSVMIATLLSLCFCAALVVAAAPRPAASTTANTPGIPARAEVSIDAVTVLLPAHVATEARTFVVYYPVQAHGGCFQWRTSNPALVQVQPIAATVCTEEVERRNPVTGATERVRVEGHTGVYVSAAATLPPGALQPDEGAGTGPTAPGAPHTSNRSFQRRLQAWISAHDLARPDRFAECEIFIDRIARLEILTSTRRINVGDVEALQLAAYDSMDNVFSSLDGLPFNWVNPGPSVLKDISLLESGLVVSASVWELDRAQVATNVWPVRGQTPGRVNVTVQLADNAHPVEARAEFLVIEPLWLKPANARLAPGSEMRVQLLTRFREERIVHTDRGSVEESPDAPAVNESAPTAFTSIHRREIAMPSAQYAWSSSAPEIAWVHPQRGLVVAKRTGQARISVTDVNAPEHTRSSDVLVVEPESIVLELRALSPIGEALPSAGAGRRVQCDGAWHATRGAAFELLIFLLDSQGFKVAVTPNMDFELSFRGASVARAAGAPHSAQSNAPTSPLPSNTASATPPGAQAFVPPSSSSIYLLASELGVTTLSVALSSVKSVQGGVEYALTTRDGRPRALTATARIVVSEPVRVAAESLPAAGGQLVLPYLGAAVHGKYPLRAEGGSGQFQWRSSDVRVATVQTIGSNQTASVELVAAGPLPAALAQQVGSGVQTEMYVLDACNPESESLLPVTLLSPGSISFLSLERQEAVVSAPGATTSEGLDRLDVYVSVQRADGQNAFDNCDTLFLHASLPTGAHVFHVVQPNGTSSAGSSLLPVFRCQTRCPIDASRNCFHLALQAVRPGFAQLRVQLVDSKSAHATPLAAAATEVFSAFAPPSAGPSPLLLSVGSSSVVSYVGGPWAWPRSGFAEQQSLGSNSDVSLRVLEESAGGPTAFSGPSSMEARFVQTFAATPEEERAPPAGVLPSSELGGATWLAYDQTGAQLVGVRLLESGIGSGPSFEVTCLRAEETLAPLTVHVLFGNTHASVLRNPLLAHASVTVYCFPPLRMPQTLSVGIGGRRSLELLDTEHVLKDLVRFERGAGAAGESAAAAATIIDVDPLTGLVHGRRLGQVYVNARVDRAALLRQLGFTVPAESLPAPSNDGLSARTLVSVEFDDFRIRLSNPRMASTLLLRQHASFAYIVGVNDETPVDESYEHVQCEWRVEGNTGGLQISPVLAATASSSYVPPATVLDDSSAASVASSGASLAYGCSVRLFGARSGAFKLSVRVAVAMAHASAKSRFEHSITVHVIEPLQLLSPASLLLPAGASAPIVTNMQAIVQQANDHGAGALKKPSLTFKLLSYTCSPRVGKRTGAGVAEEHVPYVSVDDKGVISVRPRTAVDEQLDEGSADAVILVQSTHHSPDPDAEPAASLDAPDTLGASPLTQTLTIQVSVRPIAQLFLVPSPYTSSLLCPGANYSFSVGIADPLGRKFDVVRAVSETGRSGAAAAAGALAGSSVVATAEQGLIGAGESSITVQRVSHTAGGAGASGDSQVLAQFVVQVGESNKHVSLSNPASQSLHALQDFMLHFSLPSHPLVSPMFLQLYVAPTTALCAEPAPVLLQLRLSLSASSWSAYPSHSVHRDQFAALLSQDVSSALNLTGEAAARVRIINIDPAHGVVDMLLLPKSYGAPFHRDQWFLAYFKPLQLESPSQQAGAKTAGTAHSADAWLSVPFNLAQALQKQATDKTRQAAVWRGALSHSLDAQTPFLTREISIAEAEILLHERRGSSSALSAPSTPSPTGSSTSPAASAHSVWADEREMATWSRVLDQSARDSNPLAAAQAAAAQKPASADVAGAGSAGSAESSASPSTKGDDSSASSEALSRREEDEQRWREVKRRYEADRLREAGIYVGGSGSEYYASSSASNTLLRTLGLLWTLMAAAVGGLYLFWALTSPGASASRARGFAGPGMVAVASPPEPFLVWLARVADEFLCCRRRGAAQVVAGTRGLGRVEGAGVGGATGGFGSGGLIDPMAGPSERSWQAQRHFSQEPAQRVYVASPMRGAAGVGGLGGAGVVGGAGDFGPLQRIQHVYT